ncbi:MAG: hypothetical protein HEQ23_03620 [Tepidisphaera sp.]
MKPGTRATVTVGAALAAWCLLAGVGGCLATSEPGLSSRDPAERVDAMIDAAATRDRRAIPGLIERLDSQDGGERLLAITALKRITGETQGYEHAGPPAERDAAVARWRTWEQEQRATPSAGAATKDGVNNQ